MEDVDVFRDLARSAIAIPGIVSAAIFMQLVASESLGLAAAAGIDGEPLRQLSVAVHDPAHPIPRTLVDANPAFDVVPTAPGGPALRSHLPIHVDGDGTRGCVGVLAVAHDAMLDAAAREALGDLAVRAGQLAGSRGQ